MKAQYTAAKAISSVDESTAGISKSFNDSGAALQRAQDKIATMQARSGALDELLESGVLEDVGGGGDDIQKELDKVGQDASVDSELAALKAQLGTGAPEPEALAAGAEPAAASAAPDAAPEAAAPPSS
jgi:phage shock protein A